MPKAPVPSGTGVSAPAGPPGCFASVLGWPGPVFVLCAVSYVSVAPPFCRARWGRWLVLGAGDTPGDLLAERSRLLGVRVTGPALGVSRRPAAAVRRRGRRAT